MFLTLLWLVLDYQPDLFLLFSHLITSLLWSYSLPKWSHLFPGFNTLWMQMTPSVTRPRLDLFLVPDLHFQLPPSCYLYLLASQWSQSSHISNIDLSVFLLNFQISIPHSWPLPPLSPAFPVSLSLLFTQCSGQKIIFDSSWFLTPHSIHPCGLVA